VELQQYLIAVRDRLEHTRNRDHNRDRDSKHDRDYDRDYDWEQDSLPSFFTGG